MLHAKVNLELWTIALSGISRAENLCLKHFWHLYVLLYHRIQVVSWHYQRRFLLLELQPSFFVWYLAKGTHIMQVNIAAIASLSTAHIDRPFLMSTLEYTLLRAYVLAVLKLILCLRTLGL